MKSVRLSAGRCRRWLRRDLVAIQILTLLVMANRLAGGVVAFQIALNFYYLAIAVGATPVALSLLPRLARMHLAGDRAAFKDTLVRGLALGFFVTIPAALGYLALAQPLARAISFGRLDSATGVTLVAFSIAALSLAVVGQTAFMIATYASYAMKDTRSPLISMLVQASVCLALATASLLVHGATVLLVLGASPLRVERRCRVPSHRTRVAESQRCPGRNGCCPRWPSSSRHQWSWRVPRGSWRPPSLLCSGGRLVRGLASSLPPWSEARCSWRSRPGGALQSLDGSREDWASCATGKGDGGGADHMVRDRADPARREHRRRWRRDAIGRTSGAMGSARPPLRPLDLRAAPHRRCRRGRCQRARPSARLGRAARCSDSWPASGDGRPWVRI